LIRNLAGYLTSTIGLICTRHENGINIMAAEWTYLVSKEPPQAAVVISDETFTQANALSAGEFSVTLCSADQAPLADFVGSVSGRDIDKTTSELIELCEPVAISTPWVGGGVASLECQITQVVDLPGYQMLIGEVLAIHADEAKLGNPLVKHGAMYSLGAPLHNAAVVAAAEFRPGLRPYIHVAAAGHAPDESAVWQVFLNDARGRTVSLGSAASTNYDDLLASFEIPKAAAGWNLSVAEVLVRRDGLKPGRARVSCRPTPPDRYPDSGPAPRGNAGGLRPAPRGQTKQKALIMQGGGVIEDAEACP
jgi:flavin reductase (DIM6/NTAB) family NADH-FMN oxidoreductase RutF